jgi:poly(A) polymerase
VSWKKPQFPISGSDVMAAGIPAGPQVGKALAKLENQWVDENFAPDRATLLARLKQFAASGGWNG